MKDFEAEAYPKYEIYKDKADKFRFRLRAANGQIIAASQGYKTKAACAKGIESACTNAVWADIVEEGVFADKVIYGNICTMDDKNPTAEAAAVFGGHFVYVGDRKGAKEFIGKNTRVVDYGENFIYPGFMESHCHSYLAGDRAIGQANLAQIPEADYPKYLEIIKDFIAKNPQREYYLAAGWVENDVYVDRGDLDEICADKPLLVQTGGGHSMLLNTIALKLAGIDAAYAKEKGYDLVHVDANGEPDGYICEAPVFCSMRTIRKSYEKRDKTADFRGFAYLDQGL